MKNFRVIGTAAMAPTAGGWPPEFDAPVTDVNAVMPTALGAAFDAAFAAVNALIADSAQSIVKAGDGRAARQAKLAGSGSGVASATQMRGARGKGGGVRAIGGEDQVDDDILINQMTGQLATDLIARQPPLQRGRRRRGNRVGAVGSAGGSGGVDFDDIIDDVVAPAMTAVMAPPATVEAALSETSTPSGESASIVLEDIQRLACLSELARAAWQRTASSDSSSRQSQRQAQYARDLHNRSQAAPGSSSISARQGGHGHAGEHDSSDSPASGAQDLDQAASDEAGVGSIIPFRPPLMNRRLETNGVDDSLILSRALRLASTPMRSLSLGPVAVTEPVTISSRMPPLLQPASPEVKAWTEADTSRNDFPRLSHLDLRQRRGIIGMRRWRPSPSRRQVRPEAYRNPAGRCSAVGVPVTSDPCDASTVECVAFWVGGYTCRLATSTRVAGISADSPASNPFSR